MNSTIHFYMIQMEFQLIFMLSFVVNEGSRFSSKFITFSIKGSIFKCKMTKMRKIQYTWAFVSDILVFYFLVNYLDSYWMDQSLLPLTQNLSLDWTRHPANNSSFWSTLRTYSIVWKTTFWEQKQSMETTTNIFPNFSHCFNYNFLLVLDT